MKKTIAILVFSAIILSIQSCIVCRYSPEPTEQEETVDRTPIVDQQY